MQRSNDEMSGMVNAMQRSNGEMSGMVNAMHRSNDEISGIVNAMQQSNDEISGMVNAMQRSNDEMSGIVNAMQWSNLFPIYTSSLSLASDCLVPAPFCMLFLCELCTFPCRFICVIFTIPAMCLRHNT